MPLLSLFRVVALEDWTDVMYIHIHGLTQSPATHAMIIITSLRTATAMVLIFAGPIACSSEESVDNNSAHGDTDSDTAGAVDLIIDHDAEPADDPESDAVDAVVVDSLDAAVESGTDLHSDTVVEDGADSNLDAPLVDEVSGDADTADDTHIVFDILQDIDGGSPSPFCAGESGTTYFVRIGGGDATQCNGLVNEDYPGTGSSQPCAFNHPFVALPPGGTPLLAGGDRLIIARGSYRMGQGAPGTEALGACDTAFTWDCMMPSIPSGPDADHPTCIVGEDWDTCEEAPELYAVERPWAVLDLNGSSHVRVECLELTDHSDCIYAHTGGLACSSWDTYPHGEHGDSGIRATDSSDVTLRHLNIHGFPDVGILAVKVTDWTLEHVRISGNGWAGWNGDDGSGDVSNSGTMRFNNVEITWNGCGETYPDENPTACWAQSAGGYGDGLGTGATGGDWIFQNCNVSHNTSDGIDLLYHTLGGQIVVDRMWAEGNAGNQVKFTGDTTVTNSVIIGNCSYFEGQPFTYWVDACRAMGNSVVFALTTGMVSSLVNSTVYGEGDILVEFGPRAGCDGTETFSSLNNIFIGGNDFTYPGTATVLYYQVPGCPTVDFVHEYGITYSISTASGPVLPGGDATVDCTLASNNLCSTDPMVVGALSAEEWNFQLSTGSPAIDSGLEVGGDELIPAHDYLGIARPQRLGVDRGAYEME